MTRAKSKHKDKICTLCEASETVNHSYDKPGFNTMYFCDLCWHSGFARMMLFSTECSVGEIELARGIVKIARAAGVKLKRED